MQFDERRAALAEQMAACRLCGNRCRVDRSGAETSVCGAGPTAEISWCGLHRGEEPPISGERGCGNVFFHFCNLSCVYCQNWQISNANEVTPLRMGPAELADTMIRLQEEGAQTVGLVSPTSHLPTIVPALELAQARGLTAPVVYNTGGFDTVEALRLLEGLVSIYMPDMKYATDMAARVYSGVTGYVETNRAAVLEMLRQVGGLETDAAGVARRGLLVRHLVLPGGLSDTVEVLGWIARNLPRTVPVSLMGQYNPAYQVLSGLYPELGRKLTAEEYQFYRTVAEELGLEYLYVQDLSATDVWNPDFRRTEPF
jgi:putative pyruvate formate lyase activating enzyme